MPEQILMPGLAASDSPPSAPPAGGGFEDPARRPRGLIRCVWQAMALLAEWLFGIAALVLGLAILATIPILQFLSLGYLLEVSGRVARSGRLRDGFVGVRKAARVGSIALGCWLLLWPVRFASSMWTSAYLIDPTSPATRGWRIGLVALSAAVAVQITSACLRGGRLRSFFLPRPIHFLRQLLSRGAYARARDALWDFVVSLRLPYYFTLGLRGFFGALVWLVIPISLLAIASRLPGLGPIVGLLGGGLTMLVVVHLPFLQTRLAVENRWGAMLSLRANRQLFARAPIAYFAALLFTLLLAVPLYLLKIEIIPREAAWLPSLLFVMSMLPARLLAGWAYNRAQRRSAPRHWFWRWFVRLGMLPVAAAYVLIVYFTQYLSWYGVWSLYEQHAFLVPVPFLDL